MNVSVIYSIHPHAETLKRELLHISAFLAKKILRNRYPKDKRKKARSDRAAGYLIEKEHIGGWLRS